MRELVVMTVLRGRLGSLYDELLDIGDPFFLSLNLGWTYGWIPCCGFGVTTTKR